MHKFLIGDDEKNILGEDLIKSILKITLPEKIIMLRYDLLTKPIILGNDLILGYTKNESTKNYLYINLKDNSVNHKWNYEKSSSVFINSNIELLEKSLNVLDFYLDDLIEQKELGEYHIFHQRYANLLERLLTKIDSKSVLIGFWQNLIEEMKLGVI
ncbi:hypothetical protein K5V07_00505 [Flavobacterium sp. CHNK8]|uniref:hypothetical protein n=1 Tax=Flavobacterium sp. CHNK8 TaxID=2871165 RepID=UPI001C8DC1AC|nr:hypothetical protein [Flavobacterium sp. CHNK8]QZK89051.1 hypothetical protein K5V07_00505 [Flavobacterium sp. CHNK8]